MREERKETWRKGIKITDLKEGDVIYIQKIKGGFSITIECKFISFVKGIVRAEVVYVKHKWDRVDFPKGMIITARKKKCFLWGKDPDSSRMWAYCNWFK